MSLPRMAELQAHFQRVREIIEAEEMWERVPEAAREFSPQNLEDLVKFAYFGGFVDMGMVRRLLFLEKQEVRPRIAHWYEEVREKGCWLC